MGNSRLVFLDLCSGLGGASQPALGRGWTVIRVDIDPRFRPDIVADVRDVELVLWLIRGLGVQHINVAWASPPCDEFTKAGLPQSWACNRARPPNPQIDITAGCYAIILGLAPDSWIIENVANSRKYLSPLLGPVRALVDGHALWGLLPCLVPQTRSHKWRLPPSPDRAAIRAMIPAEIGEAICRAVEARHER